MEEEQEMEMEALQLELDSLLCEARLEKLDQFVNSLRTQAENSKQLQAEVQELKSEIASLKQSFQSHSSQYQPNNSPRGPSFSKFQGPWLWWISKSISTIRVSGMQSAGVWTELPTLF